MKIGQSNSSKPKKPTKAAAKKAVKEGTMVARQLTKEELIQRFVASELQASTKRSSGKKKAAEAIDEEQDHSEETPTLSLQGKS